MPEAHLCGHCRLPLRGFGGAGDDVLCHPTYGVDCYRLVTVYDHPVPCRSCRDVRVLMLPYEDQLEFPLGRRAQR